MMRLPVWLFLILLALCAVYGSFWFLEAPPNASGINHPTFDTMLQGGDGAARHRPMLWLGWLAGVLQILFFVGLVLLGLRRGDRVTAGRGAVIGAAVAFLAVFTLLVRSYRGFMLQGAGAESQLFLGFPAPTAWMLFGLWTVPGVFLILYVLRFDSWILDAEALARFERLLAQRRGGER